MKRTHTPKTTKKIKQKHVDYSAWSDEYWLNRIQILISKHSTAPFKEGKYKGHSKTDTSEWIKELQCEIEEWIQKNYENKRYDENMLVASLLGRTLVVWYSITRRAKSFDPNRPISRKDANVLINEYVGDVVAAMTSDELMGAIYGKHQWWNIPFGKGAIGGEFA